MRIQIVVTTLLASVAIAQGRELERALGAISRRLVRVREDGSGPAALTVNVTAFGRALARRWSRLFVSPGLSPRTITLTFPDGYAGHFDDRSGLPAVAHQIWTSTMFILFHLLTGLIVGYLLADRLGTRAVVLPCMLGVLLPDLVDKPVGIFLLGGAVGEGRIFTHDLLFLLILLLAGVVVYRRYGRPALLAAGVGVASHQALDLMWSQPKVWLFPFLGPTEWVNTEDWVLRELLLELTNPLEWASVVLLLVMLLPILRPRETAAFAARYHRALRAVALMAVPLLSALGLYLIATEIPDHYSPLTGWKPPCYTVICGLVLLLTAYASYRLSVRLASGAGGSGHTLDSLPITSPQE